MQGTTEDTVSIQIHAGARGIFVAANLLMAGALMLAASASAADVPLKAPADFDSNPWGTVMKKLWLAIVASVALAAGGPAIAADLAVKAPVYKAPPIVVPVWSWSGFYVGGNVGYSWGRARTD